MNAYLFVNLTLEGISVIFLHLFYVYDNSFPSSKIFVDKTSAPHLESLQGVFEPVS